MPISAADADAMLSRPWFDGYTSEVEFHDAPVVVDDFDAEVREQARGDTEMILFGRGLSVRGSMTLARYVHSIFAVKGNLEARRLRLGDAILVVEGSVRVEEWVHLPESEGVFEVNGHQIEGADPADFAAQIDCPVVLAFSREHGEYLLFRRVGGTVTRATEADLLPEIAEKPDWITAVIERLEAGEPIFPR